MITYISDNDIFESKADALVNPVNCKGRMGKGIALEFKKRFPECIPPYQQACSLGKLVPGIVLFICLMVKPEIIEWKRPGLLLFPTKDHWRDKSKLDWIDQGLLFLRKHYEQWGLTSAAMPQLGCGLGGLYWDDVKFLIEKHFRQEPLEVEVYLNAVTNYKELNATQFSTMIFEDGITPATKA